MTTSKRRTTTKRSACRRNRASTRRSHYGSVFFAVLAVTVASALGFFGIVASVLAGS